MPPSNPQLLKTITFSLDGTDFSPDVLDVEVVPAAGDVQSVRTLDGVLHQDAEGETWALRIRAIIDWDSTRPGLAWFLWENRGTEVPFLFRDTTAALSTTKPGMGGNVICVPISYGGTGNEYAEAEVLLPLDGDPVPDTTP
jgi:hypothetical protein